MSKKRKDKRTPKRRNQSAALGKQRRERATMSAIVAAGLMQMNDQNKPPISP